MTDQLSANLDGQSYGARFEAGYRYGVLPTLWVTPYGALQLQDFHTPSCSEADATIDGFGLSYSAMNATDVRSKLGARFDDPMLLYGKPRMHGIEVEGKRISGPYVVRDRMVIVTASDRTTTGVIADSMLNPETLAKTLLLQLHRNGERHDD